MPVRLVHFGGDRVDGLAFQRLVRLDDPGRAVHRTQVMVSVRLHVDERNERDGLAVSLDHVHAPRSAAGDVRLEACPHVGLFDWQRHAGIGRRLFHLLVVGFL